MQLRPFSGDAYDIAVTAAAVCEVWILPHISEAEHVEL